MTRWFRGATEIAQFKAPRHLPALQTHRRLSSLTTWLGRRLIESIRKLSSQMMVFEPFNQASSHG
jgi:hypothetical protein